jgi:hypothetical protein
MIASVPHIPTDGRALRRPTYISATLAVVRYSRISMKFAAGLVLFSQRNQHHDEQFEFVVFDPSRIGCRQHRRGSWIDRGFGTFGCG